MIMRRSSNILTVIFVVVSIGEVLSHLMQVEILHLIFKPLLLIVISVLFYLETKSNYTSFAKLMQAGFLLAWLGDVLLMFVERDPMFFMLGLGAFLTTHILYALAFKKSVSNSESTAYLKKSPMAAAPFVLLGGVLLYMLYPNLNELLIPVFIYTAVIVTMVICALNRRGRVSDLSYKLIYYGALVFMLSDSLLAVNKFMNPIPYSGVFIMVPYIVAQFMIMKGSIVQVNQS
ncbi:MAG TPA: lysoplasmalogenase [Flavobacteriales bacterium]|nr:lysoplasmalogenase [Flavobacteriales bacterium]